MEKESHLDDLVRKSIEADRERFKSSLRPLRAVLFLVCLVGLAGVGTFFYFSWSDTADIFKRPEFYIFLGVSVAVAVAIDLVRLRVTRGLEGTERVAVDFGLWGLNFVIFLVWVYFLGAWFEGQIT